MAKESFDKEIQFLRLLALTGGGYDRQQFAGRLGISVHTFDKTVRRLREISGDADFADLFRYSYADSAEPVLLFLYRAKSMKESESRRLPLILTRLKNTPHTAAELLDACCEHLPVDAAMPDEKTIRSDLRYLEEIGVVRRQLGGRPVRYVLNNDLTDCLSPKELIDLYEFVDIMANTQIPSVQGYLLRDNLKKALRSAVPEEQWDDGLLEPFSYKYHYDARILDEAHLYTLLRTIHLRKRISFQYFSPKNRKSYAAKETNPLFGRETEVRRETTLPLKVVYDHQYGRWYLIGAAGKGRFVKFRMEGMIDIAEDEDVPEAYFTLKKDQLDERMRRSWLIDTGETVTVRAKFYRPHGQADFIEERVKLQGQWGEIVEENEDFFVYEIEVNGTTEIRPWLRGFGSSCEVLAPADLRQSFIDEWKEIGDYYDASV